MKDVLFHMQIFEDICVTKNKKDFYRSNTVTPVSSQILSAVDIILYAVSPTLSRHTIPACTNFAYLKNLDGPTKRPIVLPHGTDYVSVWTVFSVLRKYVVTVHFSLFRGESVHFDDCYHLPNCSQDVLPSGLRRREPDALISAVLAAVFKSIKQRKWSGN